MRAPEPRAEPVSRFYTRDAPDELTGDYTVNQLVETAYFDRDISSDQRAEFRQALRDYVEAEYDIRWDDYFDWEAWRAEMGY